MQQAKVARGCAALGSQVKDIDCRREEEGELQGVADRREGVGCWIVGWEDGDVQGVVLCVGAQYVSASGPFLSFRSRALEASH